MPTYSEVQEQIRKLQKQADEIRAKEIADVIEDIKAKIQLYDLTEKDLGLGENGENLNLLRYTKRETKPGPDVDASLNG